MRLTVFQSDKGDCLLLDAGETRILVDGGMRGSFTEHVAAALGELREAGKSLDVVYLSHIDQDHVGGVLRLLEDELAWRVHDYQLGAGNGHHPVPKCPRPPEIGELWHNGFRELVEENAGEIEELLAASAAVLEGGADPEARQQALVHRELATSIPEAITLSHRLRPEQLDIPLNKAFGGKLALRRDDAEQLEFGSLRLTLIGPAEADLDELRKEWNLWLQTNRDALADLRENMRADVERLGSGELGGFQAGLEAEAGELADRTAVTVPNLASLMFLVEEGERRLLLTGDGHARDI